MESLSRIVYGRTFRYQHVPLDGREFHNCHFDRCTLVFSGTSSFELVDCTFDHVGIEATSAAEVSVRQLEKLSRIDDLRPGMQGLANRQFPW